MAYAHVPMGFGLCHIGHGDSNVIYYLLPIKTKTKTKTSGKRQRERKKDRDKFQISGVLSFDPGPN
jgi:hypothetical protein